MSAVADRAGDIFDLLVAAPDGLTIVEITDALACSHELFRGALQALRDSLGDTDSINVVVEAPDWKYRLVGSLDEAKGYVGNRLADTERRLRTQLQVATSLASGTKATTTEGKMARLLKKSLARLLEDMTDLREESSV
jgi:hypothetical protein